MEDKSNVFNYKERIPVRLYNIYYICNITVDKIRNVRFELNSKKTYNIFGWKEAKESMLILRKVPFLLEYVDDTVKSVPAYVREDKNPEVDSTTCSNVKGKIQKLQEKIETVIELYESIQNGEAQEGIDIKIPNCASLKEYIQYMKDIDFVLSQCPFISKSEEEIVFNTVDVGSMWLSFFVKAAAGSYAILSTISKMTELALKVKSNNVVIKQQEEMLETMRQKNDVGQEVIDVFKKMKDKMLDESVSELEQECNMNITEPEERDRARRSIDTLAELIEKGVEIYSAIETPEEIKVLFPFVDDSPTIPEGLLKLIESKEDNAE